MIIKNFNNQYYVIEKRKSTSDFDILYCKLIDDDSGKEKYFDLIKIKNREKMKYLIQAFTEKESNYTFYDLYECFSKNGFFYIAFIHVKGQSLREKLSSERCTLRERLEIGKNIMERAILLSMPLFLQNEVMNPDNIIVSSDLSISFSYEISSLPNSSEMKFDLIMDNLTSVMEFLFSVEIERNESEDIKKFIETCNEYNFKDFLEFFQEYTRFYDVIISQDAGGFIKPNTLLFRIWKKIKHFFVKAKGILIKIVLLILIIFMLKTIFATEEKQGTDFKRIGTVDIEKEKNSE